MNEHLALPARDNGKPAVVDASAAAKQSEIHTKRTGCFWNSAAHPNEVKLRVPVLVNTKNDFALHNWILMRGPFHAHS